MKQLRSPVDVYLSLLIVAVIVILDRVTKSFFAGLLSPGESIPIINNIFHFTLVHNTGIAFGMFKDQGIVFIIIPLIAIVLLAYNIYYYQNVKDFNGSYIIGFSLILAGAIGNLYDRIFIGHVIDFVDLRVWPVFNIADSAITIGAVVVLIKCFRTSKNAKS